MMALQPRAAIGSGVSGRSRPYRSVEQLYRASQASYANAGGFLVEDDDDECEQPVHKKSKSKVENLDSDFVHDNAAECQGSSADSDPQSENLTCLACGHELAVSFLLDRFSYAACDKCREINREKYSLITRTEAKKVFLLKDCDFDSRQPRLKYISKKNPHNPRWGDMKLYLKLQVEQRALQVWNSWDELEEVKLKKEAARSKVREKKFQKDLRIMRAQVRRDPANAVAPSVHRHEYGEEVYDAKSDTYSQKCQSCQHVNYYEKL